MITAKEALAASKKTQTDQIEGSIQNAISQGLYEVSFQRFLSEENKKLLKENGFTLSKIKLTDGDQHTINWENA